MDSATWIVAVLLVAWFGGGLVAALRMARRGHSLKLALPLGLILGPFLALYEGEAERPSPRATPTLPSKEPGAFNVLIGVDGSKESEAAVRAAVDLLGGSMTSLTLATVLAYEDRGPRSGLPAQSVAYGSLVDLASQLDFEPIEMELLYGAPAEALAERAADGADLIVVGARGQGLTNRLLGSVATELAGTSAIPVLIGPSLAAVDGRAEGD